MMTAILVLVFFLGVFAVVTITLIAASHWIEKLEAGGIPHADGLDLSGASPLLKAEVLSTISPWAFLLSKFAFADKLKTLLAEADLNWSVGRLTSMMLLSGGVWVAVIAKIDFFPAWAVILSGVFMASAPCLYVGRVRRRRLARIEEQLPDALDFLARSLRAGHPFSAALEMLGNEKSPPLAPEIRRTAEERRLGLHWDTALENLCRRVPLQEMSVFAAAVQLQNRTGGKLNEVLVKIAENMREVSAVRGEVRSISAHGRMTGVILTVMPIVIVVIMSMVNPDYLGILLNHPHGKDLIAAAIGCLVLAQIVIRRLMAIRV